MLYYHGIHKDADLILFDVTKVGNFGDDIIAQHRLTATNNLESSTVL